MTVFCHSEPRSCSLRRRISYAVVETLTALHPQRGACVAIAQGDMLEIRLLLMPIGHLLVGVSDLEQG